MRKLNNSVAIYEKRLANMKDVLKSFIPASCAALVFDFIGSRPGGIVGNRELRETARRWGKLIRVVGLEDLQEKGLIQSCRNKNGEPAFKKVEKEKNAVKSKKKQVKNG